MLRAYYFLFSPDNQSNKGALAVHPGVYDFWHLLVIMSDNV
jgi:hypothetical protein